MRRIASVLLALAGAGAIMLQVGPHDAATNFCNWFSFWHACMATLPDWFNQWAWTFPAGLFVAAVIVLLWAPIAHSIQVLKRHYGLVDLKVAAAHIYGELRGTDLGRFTEGHTGSEDEILDNVGMQILHNATVLVRRAPSPTWEVFPKSELSKMGVFQGATGIRFWGESQAYYVDPRVSRRNMRRVARLLKKNANYRSSWSVAPPIAKQPIAPVPTSPLEMSFGTSIDFYAVIRDKNYPRLHSLMKLFKLKLENKEKSKAISGIRVSVTAVSTLTSGFRFPWILADDLLISAGDHEMIPFARYEEWREPEKQPTPLASDTIEIVVPESDRFRYLGVEETHTLQLRCTGVDVPPSDATIKLSVVSGSLRIEKI